MCPWGKHSQQWCLHTSVMKWHTSAKVSSNRGTQRTSVLTHLSNAALKTFNDQNPRSSFSLNLETFNPDLLLFFFILFFGLYLAALGITQGCAWEQYGMLGMDSELASHKASTLPAMQSLTPLLLF